VEEDVAPYDFATIYNLPSGWPNSNNGSGQTIAIIGTSDIDLTDVSNFAGRVAHTFLLRAHSHNAYVPETPWNDTCLNPIWTAYFQSVAPLFNYTALANAEAACNFIYSDWTAVNQDNQNNGGSQFVMAPWVDTIGGSGGASGCVVNNADSATAPSCGAGDTSTGSTYGNLTLFNNGWPKPSWQSNAAIPGLPADGVRDLPDVSFFSGDGALESATLICVSNDGASCTSISATASGGTGEAEEVGGTSVATPEMAGVMALINQKADASQGSPNAELYALAAKQTYSSCSAETGSTSSGCFFNDIDQGTIAMPCDYEGNATEGGAIFDPSSGLWEATTTSAGMASPNCSIVNSGDVVGTLSGYGAITGYDQATGLGSLNVANVVNAWTATTGTGTATVTVTPAQTTIPVNQGLSVTVALSVASGTPTGTVTLAGPGYVGTPQTVGAGPYTFTIPADGLSGGTDTLIASYSGDANFAEAQGSATVTVTKLTSAITVTPGSSSIGSGASLTVTGTISAAGGPTATGTVTLTGGGYASPATLLSGGSYSIVIPSGALNVGSDTLTISYSGDSNYTAVSGTTTVTVTASSYTLSASAPTAVSPGISASSTVTVSTTTSYAGIISMACTLTSSPTGATTATLPSCAPAAGSATVTLKSGASTGTATMTVTTTAATTGALVRPALRGNGRGLMGAGSAVLALLVLLGIPARRRGWQAMLGAFVLLAALGSLAACGGGGSSGSGGGGSGGGGGTSIPGTTAGTYTFTVTGTGNPPLAPPPTATFTLTVN
jgi:hypothetical protein